MNGGQLAALIAAGFFAALACVAGYVLIRLGRLMTAATGMVTQYRDRADQLIEQAQAAVDRTNEQLARTDAITASMDQVTANMAELSGHVSALAGLARASRRARRRPADRLSAFAFGLRRAVALRRSTAGGRAGRRPGRRPRPRARRAAAAISAPGRAAPAGPPEAAGDPARLLARDRGGARRRPVTARPRG